LTVLIEKRRLRVMNNNKNYYMRENCISDEITMEHVLKLYAEKIIDGEQIHHVLDLVLQAINEGKYYET